MVKLEEKEFEDLILQSRHHVAVPFELSVMNDGSLDILTYSICKDIAEEFEKLFEADPLSREAMNFLNEKLSPIMESLGYLTYDATSRLHYEFRADTAINKTKITPECVIIDTLEGEAWDNIALHEFSLDPDNPMDRMAVIRDGDKIVCYAALNDDIDNDGFSEITVECEENYRRKGYGVSCVACLTDYLISMGKKVKYICSVENTPSIRTAESAGLKLYRRTMPYVCWIAEDEEETD